MRSWQDLLSFIREKLRTGLTRLRNDPSPRKFIPLLLMLVGVVLLAYVASQYWGMHHSQEKLTREWERQAATANIPGHAVLSPQDMLTRVIIKKIGLDAIVVEGASRKQLSEGPGHMKDTAMPGEPGNAVITGHRDTFFRHIYELNKGDEILVRRAGQVFRFAVTGKKIVYPEDMSVIRPTSDAQLTLITCYPTYYIGPAPKRLVVFSRLEGTGADLYKEASAK
ncbi:MAG TPA: class D sortase [Terriglobales bacterium]|nr:class D sortase [Terriglobales bacterium]